MNISNVSAAQVKGGAVLEYPRGRFQEYSSPNFFNWTITKPVKSVALKVFRADENFQYNADTDLIARYDFLNTTKSASWTQESFSRGKYVWVIEGYNEKDAKPIYVDTAQFEVEQLKHLDLRTRQFGLLVGFSRGKYTSLAEFAVEFDTTPTTYGMTIKGGNPNRTWNFVGQMSDFILQGSVRQNATLYADYDYLMTKAVPYETEIFLGPSLRIFQFSRAEASEDGAVPPVTTLAFVPVTLINPGLALTVQKQFDLHITMYSKLNLDVPAAASEKMDFSFDQTNVSARAGILYGLFWPIGFSGEIQYNMNRSKTKSGALDVEVKMEEWAVGANLLYAF